MHRTKQKSNIYSTPEISILLFLSTENWTSESINLQANKSLDCSSLLSPLLLTQSQNKKSPISSCSYRISNPHCIGPPRARTKNHLFNLEKKKKGTFQKSGDASTVVFIRWAWSNILHFAVVEPCYRCWYTSSFSRVYFSIGRLRRVLVVIHRWGGMGTE